MNTQCTQLILINQGKILNYITLSHIFSNEQNGYLFLIKGNSTLFSEDVYSRRVLLECIVILRLVVLNWNCVSSAEIEEQCICVDRQCRRKKAGRFKFGHVDARLWHCLVQADGQYIDTDHPDHKEALQKAGKACLLELQFTAKRQHVTRSREQKT